jgi:glucose/arabinose dehydrogenase
MKSLPLLQSPDPLTPEEVRDVKKTFQKERSTPQLRRTKLASLAAERAESLRALTLPEGSLVQASAWGDARRAVVHLLNFRTPIGLANGGKVVAVSNVNARLRLPKGKTARQVRVYSADAPSEPKSVAFKQKGDAVEFTLPPVRVYSVCEVTF